MQQVKPFYLLAIIPFIITSVANISLVSETYQVFISSSDMLRLSKLDIYFLWLVFLGLPIVLHYALSATARGSARFTNLHIALSCLLCGIIMLVFCNYPLMPVSFNEMAFENPFTNRMNLYINTSVYLLSAFAILQLLFLIYGISQLLGGFHKKNIILG